MVPLRITRLGDDMQVLLGAVSGIVSAAELPGQETPGLEGPFGAASNRWATSVSPRKDSRRPDNTGSACAAGIVLHIFRRCRPTRRRRHPPSMVKDSKKYAATGGWAFGKFVDGKPADEAEHRACFACHETHVMAHDYVFTRFAP